MVSVPFTNITYVCNQNCDLFQWLIYIIEVVVVIIALAIITGIISWLWRMIKR